MLPYKRLHLLYDHIKYLTSSEFTKTIILWLLLVDDYDAPGVAGLKLFILDPLVFLH